MKKGFIITTPKDPKDGHPWTCGHGGGFVHAPQWQTDAVAFCGLPLDKHNTKEVALAVSCPECARKIKFFKQFKTT